jgi:hypothetical protein
MLHLTNLGEFCREDAVRGGREVDIPISRGSNKVLHSLAETKDRYLPTPIASSRNPKVELLLSWRSTRKAESERNIERCHPQGCFSRCVQISELRRRARMVYIHSAKLVSILKDNEMGMLEHTRERSICAIIFIIFVISVAAATHLVLLSATMLPLNSSFSAFEIAAWCKHITVACRLIFMNIVLAFEEPAGSRNWDGR